MNASSALGIRPWVPLLLGTTLVACSASEVDAPSPAQSGGSTSAGSDPAASGGASPVTELPPPPTAIGGVPDAASGGSSESPPPHPLFGAGNGAGIDEDDPCLTATRWTEETAIELEHGSVVLFEATLWELTGTSSDTWALPDCTPPGTGWCLEQYAWQPIGTCPEPSD